MASIVNISDFFGEINIPNPDQPGVSDNLQKGFIDKYEPRFLRLLLGTNFANEFMAGLADENPSQNWISLRDGTELKQAIANYIYMFWATNEASMTTGTGEAKGKNENSTIIVPTRKIIRGWNEMVGYNISICSWLNQHSTDYPTWPMTGMMTWSLESHFVGFNSIRAEIFHYKNSLGL